MATLGAITEVIDAEDVSLEIGLDTHIQLQELEFIDARPELRKPRTDGKVDYFPGSGDIFFEATLLATNSQLSVFNTDTQPDANRAFTSKAYKLVYLARDQITKTINVTAVLPSLRVVKPRKGGIKFRCRFRVITDTVSIT